MADRLFAEVAAGPLPESWRDRIVYLAESGRRIYSTHSALVQVLAWRPEDSPSLLRVNEIGLACLRDAGLDDESVGLFQQVMVSLVIGFGVGDGAWDEETDERARTRRAYSALDPAEYPAASALAPYLFPPSDESFALALRIFIAAVEAWPSRSTPAGTHSKRSAPTKKRTTR
jgi:hypothetical protein